MSWLTPVVREINADQAMTDYKRRFLDNSATPNLLIKYQQKLTPAALSGCGTCGTRSTAAPTG
jgi:hypothetical protein